MPKKNNQPFLNLDEAVEYTSMAHGLSKKYNGLMGLEDQLGVRHGTLQQRITGGVSISREAYYAMKWLHHYEQLKE